MPGTEIPRRLSALLALMTLWLLPAEAHAHGALRGSEPAAGARLTDAPRRIRLTFNEPPVPAFTRISLRAAGDLVALGPVRIVSDTVVIAEITGALSPGAHTIAWQIAGADGHPVRGELTFTIAPGATGLGASVDAGTGESGARVHSPPHARLPTGHHASPAAGTATFHAASPAFVAVRVLLYIALLTVVGAATFRQLVLRRGLADASADPARLAAELRAATIGMWAARITGVVAVLRLLAQSYAMHGAAALDASLLMTMVTRTLWGWGWMAQLGAAVVAERAFHRARGSSGSMPAGPARGSWSVATVAAVVMAATPSLASHAAAAPRLAPVAILADMLHVLCAGAWMGGLGLLLLAGVPAVQRTSAHRLDAAAGLVRAFSPVALASATILAVTGTFAAWLHIGTFGGLWATSYGRMLLVKLGVLGAVGALGFINWRFVVPQLESRAGVRWFERSGAAELGFGAVVVVVTAILVALPTN